MQVVPPISITDAKLTSSTVIETTPAVYSAGTPYAIDALVYTGTVGAALTVWKSLQSANTGNTPSSSPTWWKNMGAVYAEYASGTTYALADIVQVAATHLTYESLVAGNLGNAVTNTAKWLLLGPTNRWKMFDLLRNTQTTVPLTMTTVVTPGERINSIALLGMVANSATISVSSVIGGGVVYSTTVDLNTRNIVDWYGYFFWPFSTRASLAKFAIPPYSDCVITVTLTATSGNVSCGGLVVGTFVYLGDAQYSAESDVLNFSTVTRDVFGNSALVPRRNVPKTNQTVFCEKGRVNAIMTTRAALNAVPALWAGLDTDTDGYFEALFILGYYRKFSINLTYPGDAVISLELEEV